MAALINTPKLVAPVLQQLTEKLDVLHFTRSGWYFFPMPPKSPRPKRAGTIFRSVPAKPGEALGHYVVRCSAPDGTRGHPRKYFLRSVQFRLNEPALDAAFF